MNPASLALQIQTLPDNPGVYQYYDKDGKILYVGKAKNLKKRVSSYFNKIHDTAKTNVLVKKIVTIKHIVVPTETDALLLENNLIKTLQPRYNVLLRDDKSYPWLCIKKEPFSRIFATRRMVKDGSEYFGPYTSFKTVSTNYIHCELAITILVKAILKAENLRYVSNTILATAWDLVKDTKL